MIEFPKTSDPDLDYQHSRLIEWMNELTKALETNTSKECVERLFRSLQYYAATHFAFEEGGMHFLGYPERKGHIEEHRFFSQWLEELNDINIKEPNFAGSTVLSFLKKWLLNHIEQSDVQYADFLSQQNL